MKVYSENLIGCIVTNVHNMDKKYQFKVFHGIKPRTLYYVILELPEEGDDYYSAIVLNPKDCNDDAVKDYCCSNTQENIWYLVEGEFEVVQ